MAVAWANVRASLDFVGLVAALRRVGYTESEQNVNILSHLLTQLAPTALGAHWLVLNLGGSQRVKKATF